MADASKLTEHIDVSYLASLLRLHLNSDEAQRFESQIEEILLHVKRLQDLDLDGVEPTAHAVQVTNVWREDEPQPGLDPSDVLDNAPALQGREIRVPRIVE